MRTSFSARLAAAVLVGALSLPAFSSMNAASAADDPHTLAKARETFRVGLTSEAAGKWEAALAAFKEVALVKSTPQVRYHIGNCEEKMGHYVEALGAYRLALHEAPEVKAKDVEQAAQEALVALEPKIPKLTIERGDGATVAEVTMDGTSLGPSTIGTSTLVNPGPHIIKATAPGREPFTLEFTLADAETKTVTLVLEATKAAVAPVAPTVAPPPAEAPPDVRPAMSPLKIAGFVGAGVGVAGIVASGPWDPRRSS
jgi:hypothetical protein